MSFLRQFWQENATYIGWLCFAGAGCLALVSLHSGEKDYLDDDDEFDTW